MFEDKTLVCRTAVRNLFGLLVEQSSTHPRLRESALRALQALPTPTQERAAHAATAVSVRCPMLSAQLGALQKVPFQPREDRPVYCSDCFARMKQN